MKANVLVLLTALGLLAGSGCATHRARSLPAKLAPGATELSLDERVEALSRYATGISRELRGEGRMALDEYYKSALADPANEELVLEVARRLLRGRKTDQAIELLQRAAKVPGAGVMVHALLGAAYAQTGKTDLAVASCRKAIAADPNEFASYQNLFQVYVEATKFKEALLVADQAAKRKDADAAFLIGLSEVYARYELLRPGEKKQTQPKILATLERARKATPDDPILLLRLGDGFKANGDNKRAEELYREVLKRQSNMPTVHEKLAELYILAGDNAKAEQELLKLAADRPSNPRVWYVMGTLLAQQKQYTNAIEYLERALRLDPSLEPAYFELAGVHLAADHAADALKLMQRARTLLGDTFGVEFYSGLAHSRAKNYPAAVKAMTAAELIARTTETNRLTHTFYFQLGSVHERNQDLVTAEKYFRQCLDLEPDYAEALNYLGYMWAEHHTNLDEAHKLIARAVKQEPDNAAFLDSLGWVLFVKGRAKDALPLIEKAVKLNKEPDATLYEHLGDIQLKLGQKEKARAAWQKSLGIEKNPAVQKKLDALGSPGT
ncbi:MAG: tetratricopeptide repeat protein [Verrucomicrobia bacterium]|nr:tetratricopeptide repeat protein [Verrucomicrobiota bacterium]